MLLIIKYVSGISGYLLLPDDEEDDGDEERELPELAGAL